MNKQEVRSRIEQLGIIPSIRVSKTEDALFAAEAVARGGIPIIEVTMTVPEALKVISHLVQKVPEVIVGAGSVHDVETARQCLDSGAKFLSSDGLDPETVKFAVQREDRGDSWNPYSNGHHYRVEVNPDFVKLVPCGHIGGDSYIRDPKPGFPTIPMIAAGGVNQRTAFGFIAAGAVALGVGGELIPREAIRRRQPDRIAELAHRFLTAVGSARDR